MRNRSANTYQKINSIFFRDTNNIIMPYDSFVQPEFEYLRNIKWHAEEKIDGTNIRIEVGAQIIPGNDRLYTGVKFSVAYKGKTDNAQVPKPLMAYLIEHFPADVVLQALGLKEFIPTGEFAEHRWIDESGNPDINKVPEMYTIYGEGYGKGIQSGGYYGDVKFIGFDVKVNETYLKIESRNEILTKMGADIVPFVGDMTIDEAIEYVKKGFNSARAEVEHAAEGLVLRTQCGLLDRMGRRLIFKVKTCDFTKYFNKYGTYEQVPQEQNPHITGE